MFLRLPLNYMKCIKYVFGMHMMTVDIYAHTHIYGIKEGHTTLFWNSFFHNMSKAEM
jgi:hypothetical protein